MSDNINTHFVVPELMETCGHPTLRLAYYCSTCSAAHDAELLALRGRVARMEEALKVFAVMPYSSHWPDDEPIAADCRCPPGAAPLTVGDFRRAAAVLAEGKEPMSRFEVGAMMREMAEREPPADAAPAKCSTCGGTKVIRANIVVGTVVNEDLTESDIRGERNVPCPACSVSP